MSFVGAVRWIPDGKGGKRKQVLLCGLGAMGVGCLWFNYTKGHSRYRGYRKALKGWTWDFMGGWTKPDERSRQL